MVNRFILILLLFVQVLALNAQSYEGNRDKVLKDLMDKSKVLKLLERNDSDGTAYYYSIKDTANSNVRFKEGPKRLLQYIDSCYYSYIDFDRQAYREFHLHVAGSILFDNNLRIKDVRIVYASNHPEPLKPYDARLKKILLSTEGKWYKVNKKGKWSFILVPIVIKLLPD